VLGLAEKSLRLLSHPQIEVLATELAQTLREKPLPDPFSAEWIVIPHIGFKSWLDSFLASQLGIWSQGRFGLPRETVWDLACLALPNLAAHPRLEYTETLCLIYQELDFLLENPALALFRQWSEKNPGPTHRWQLAQQMATQFELLSQYRAELLCLWSEKPIEHWASTVWYHLCQLTEAGQSHRAAMQAKMIAGIQSGSAQTSKLPQRLSIFAVEKLPPLYFDLLQALAQIIPTTLYLSAPHASTRQHLQARNLTLEHLPQAQEPSKNLLEAVQSHLRHPKAKAEPLADKGDDSLQIHQTHGPMRELEVLHNYLIGCFAALPDLRPGEIAVVIPQLENYAPLINGVFYRPKGNPERLAYRIVPADQGNSPEVRALRSFFDLSGSRLSRDEVLALLEQGPVARHFGFDSDALALLAQWLEAVEIRWGIDAKHRKELKLPDFSENSWKQGLKRLLLGFAMIDEGLAPYQGLLPYPAMEGNAVKLLGQFLDFFDFLEQSLKILNTTQTPTKWSQILPLLAQNLLKPKYTELENWHLLLEQLSNLDALAALGSEKVSLGIVRNWLESQWSQRLWREIPQGLITFATPEQLQGLPFRVICFLGLNRGSLPRPDTDHELNLLAEDPQLGDPSLRRADRELFLDSLLSARERLFLSYTGRRVRDNLEQPPSVLISELQDTVQYLTGAKLKIQAHPLHPFDPSYFKNNSGLISFSQNAFEEALALQGPRNTPPFIDRALPAIRHAKAGDTRLIIQWRDFLAFFAQPSRAFLHQRLGLSLYTKEWQAEKSERFQLNALEIWHLRETYLEWLLLGQSSESFFERLKASSHLPLGLAGEAICSQLQTEIGPLAQTLRPLTGNALPAAPFVLPLGQWEIQGELAPLFEGGLIRTRLARIKAADRLQVWLQHLLLNCLQRPEQTFQIGLSQGQAQKIGYTQVSDAPFLLANYLQIFEQGLKSPLPLALESAWVWLQEQEKGEEKALAAAERQWKGDAYQRGEILSPEYALCLNPEWLRASDLSPTILKLYQPLVSHLQEGPLTEGQNTSL
jgi:exodeoxyribonuclease V gamma subunit